MNQEINPTDKERLQQLLDRMQLPGGAPIDPAELQWLTEFRERYPFFPLPDALQPSPGDTSAGEAPAGDTPAGEATLRQVLQAPSPEAMLRMQGKPEATRFDDFYPPVAKDTTPSTAAAIDDFLNTYGHQSEEEDMLLERLIFNPIPDYAQQLEAQERHSLPEAPDADADSQDARLNRFILSHHQSTEEKPAAKPAEKPAEKPAAKKPEVAGEKAGTTPPDGLLSMSLAKIYVKTGRYGAAYEILNGLSLRFPEKSAYFADQLRFLRKLMLIQERKAASKGASEAGVSAPSGV